MARRKVDTARGVRGTRRRNTGDNNGQTKSDPALNEALGKHLASSLMGGFTNSADVLSPALREAGINPNSYFGPKGNFRIPFLESIAAAGPNGRDVSGMLGDTGGGPSGGRVQNGGPPNFSNTPGDNRGAQGNRNVNINDWIAQHNQPTVNPGGPMQGGGTAHNHGGTRHDHQGGGPGHKHGGQDVNPGGPMQGGGGQGGQSDFTRGDFRNPTADQFGNYNQYQNAWDASGFGAPVSPSGPAYGAPLSRGDFRQAIGTGQQVNPGGPPQGQGQGGGGQGGQNQAPPPYVQNWAPAHPEAFARRFPTYADYTGGVQDPRRQGFYDAAMANMQGGGQQLQNGGPQQGGGQPAPHSHGGQPHAHPQGDQPHGHGQGGAGGGAGGQGGQAGGGGQGGGAGGGGQDGGPWATQNPDGTWSYPSPDAHMPGTNFTPVPGAGTPMTSEPASLTSAPPGSYPWAGKGYMAPPSNMTYYNPGVGGFAGQQAPSSAPVSFATADQLAQQYGLQLGLGTPPNQLPNPSGGTQPGWANPAPPGPDIYDPWIESRLIGNAYRPQGGDLGAFQQAYLQAAGGDNAYTRLALQQYLAHKAGYQGYGTMTDALPYGYVAPHG